MTIIKYAQLEEGIDQIFSSTMALAKKETRDLLLTPESAKVEAEVQERFVKFAKGLKKVSPKANDFLYFTSIMIHGAEASLIDQVTGRPIEDRNGKPIFAEWVVDKKSGSWKWKCSDPEVKPYKNCFVPGTKITMSDGTVKNIEDVAIGDEVITHKKRIQKVTNTFITPYDGNMLEINIRGNESIICTPEHPFYKLDVISYNGQKNDSQKHILRQSGSIKEYKFVCAKELEKSDLLLEPILDKVVKSDLTPGKARLLGLFAAEGSFGKKYNKYQNIRFTFSRNEYECLALPTKELLENEFGDISVRIQTPISRNICEVTASGNNICEFFKKNVGEYSLHKTLSEEILFGNTEIKENFIIGWLDGDGCVEKTAGLIIGITSSENLSNQIGIILNSLGIGKSIYRVKGAEDVVINKNYKGYVASDHHRIIINATEGSRLLEKTQRLKFTKRGGDRKQQFFYGGYSLHTINSMFDKEYCGNVYNFEVEEDNSYVANGIIVHNCNGDIFPESELKKAYRKWVGRPLCKDHQSGSVDGIRGMIIDAYYDDKFKRVIGLCALDKVNYPDLARKVSSGYAKDVSMGTAVGRSVCYNCGNVAKVEADYCKCVKNRTTYGEINLDLSPIELSLVVTGADPRAKLRHVIASLNKYSADKGYRIAELQKAGCVTQEELERLDNEIGSLKKTVATLLKVALISQDQSEVIRNLSEVKDNTDDPEIIANIEEQIKSILSESEPVEVQAPKVTYNAGFEKEPELPTYDIAEGHDTTLSADDNKFGTEIRSIGKKLDAMATALRDLEASVQVIVTSKEENFMSDTNQRAVARRANVKTAYLQGGGGVNEPHTTYTVDPTQDKLRQSGDKQMVGENMEMGSDGMYPGDEQIKQKLSRAELAERQMRRHALLRTANEAGTVMSTENGEKVLVNRDNTATKLTPSQSDDDGSVESILAKYLGEKTAYYQGGGGVNEPHTTYPVDPTQDKLRQSGDKQMVGENMETGSDGMYPGDDQIKQKLLRADQKLRAKFVMAYKNEEKTIPDKNNSRWEVYAGNEKLLAATGKEIFDDELEGNWDFLASKRYGREVLRLIRKDGIGKVAYLLKGAAPEDMPPMPELPPAPPATSGMPTGPSDPMGMGVGTEEKPEEKEAGGGVDETVDKLSKTLEEAEKDLGDLQEALEDEKGESKEDELPSAVEAADDGELVANLDQSADELALLIESIDSRAKAGKDGRDVITAELISLAKEAILESTELCKQASVVIAAKKAKKGKGKKDVVEGKGAEKDSEKDSEKDGEGKGKKGKKCPDCGEKECVCKKGKKKVVKKSSAEEMLNSLLAARAAKRREMVRNAADVVEDEENFVEKVKDALEEIFGMPVAEMKRVLEEEKLEEEHGGSGMPTEDTKFVVDADDAEDFALDDELAQLVSDPEEKKEEECKACDADDKAVTASERRAWRAKIAAEVGQKYQLKLDSAVDVDTNMPLNESFTLDFDTNTQEGTVEGIVDQHKKIMQQVQSLPKVREAMDKINGLLKAGKLSMTDLNDSKKLQALAIDPEAAKYFKDYFKQGDKDSAEYGNELTQEFAKKKSEASLDEQKVMMRRAYDLALELQDKGMIPSDPQSLHAQVDELMKFDARAFESYKKATARLAKPIKTASSVPAIQVGVTSDDVQTSAPETLSDQLKNIWNK